jgi:hypothetical protein
VGLSLSIVYGSTTYSYEISFWLKLTEKGYGVAVTSRLYSVHDDKPYSHESSIPPLVKKELIENEIEAFLKSRNEAIASLAEKEKRFHRE